MATAVSPTQHHAIYETISPVSDGELRLIILHAGPSGSEIKCDLVVRPCSTEYEALSYAWGVNAGRAEDATSELGEEWEDVDEAAAQLEELAMEDKRSIEVNGLQVDVMSNLGLALQYLRLPSTHRTLWIDYLCINQYDVKDRNAQVARMDRIYRSASRVVVWLGQESDDSDQAAGELLGLAANVHLSSIYPGTVDNTRARIRPIVSLLDRPWFSRVWVVQEVALAKEVVVQLGQRTVPWEWFLRAARVYRDHMACCAAIISPFNDSGEVDDFLGLKNGLANVLALDREALHGLSLHTALRLFYGRLATDPRDKVYGLLGLLDQSARLVDADYALTAPAVYEEVAWKIIEQSSDLAVLTDLDEYVGDVPTASWAPDWTTNAAVGLELYDHFKASGGLKAEVQRCSAHTLKITGLIFDTVSRVSQNESVEGELLAAASHLQAWEKLAAPSSEGPSPYASGQERKDALWQTVSMGMSADRSRRIRADDHDGYRTWHRWLDQYLRASNRKTLLDAGSTDATINQHNMMLASYPGTRWFFLTEDGYFGLGPVEMEPDDVVCVLAGGKMPFVLRAIDEACDVCDNDQLCYRLMGFAYVHGIMDGETVRGIEADEEAGIAFCLR